MHIPDGWELILVLLVVVLVFGSKRLPDSARALGRSVRILKAETKGLHDDDAAQTTTAQVVAPVVAAQQAPPVQPVQMQPVQTQPVQSQPVQAQPVEAQHFAGQQLFDAQGRPVLVPGLNAPAAPNGQPAQQAPTSQV